MLALPAECNVNGRGAQLKPQARTRAKAGGKAAAAGGPIDAPPVLAHEFRAMTLALARSFQLLAFAAALAARFAPARALIGAEPDSRFAHRVAMVLMRGGDKAGFCTALVLEPARASDCGPLSKTSARHGGLLSRRRRRRRRHSGRRRVRPPALSRRHNLGARPSQSISLDPDRAAASPELRRRGDRRWRTAGIGASAIVSGYGAAREGDWSSGGEARSVTLAVRDRRRRSSFGPPIRPDGGRRLQWGFRLTIWSADGSTATAIVAWAQQTHTCSPGTTDLDSGPAANAAGRLDRGDRAQARCRRLDRRAPVPAASRRCAES